MSAPASFGVPRPRTSFIGREDDLVTVASLIGETRTRLLTLCGPGGVGKTRLAIAVATELTSQFPDGVVFVDLTTVTDPTTVTRAIATASRVRESGNHSLDSSLYRVFGNSRTLLLLDNFEHVLDAAPVVSALLDRCPGLSVLVTSRERLRITGERIFLVPSLPVASREDSPALRLFLDRAGTLGARPSLQPDLEQVAEVCRRLDGLPLAIELAAARAQHLPIPALLDQLAGSLPLLTGGPRDIPERQQTMDNTIAWSYASLSEAEKLLFDTLSVFHDGWTLEAAARIATSAGMQRDEVIPGVISLAEKSLVQRAEAGDEAPRFRMLDLVREFASRKRRLRPQNIAVEQGHAEYFLEIAESQAPKVYGADGRAIVTSAEQDWANFRAAFDWFESAGYPAEASRLTHGVANFCCRSGRIAEFDDLVTRALAVPGSVPSRSLAMAMVMRVGFDWSLGKLERAMSDASDVLRFSQETRFEQGIALAFYEMIHLESARGNLQEALDSGHKAIAILRRSGPPNALAAALHETGVIYLLLEDDDNGAELMSEGLEIMRRIGFSLEVGANLPEYAVAALRTGNVPTAAARYAESAAILLQEDDLWYIANAFAGLAIVAVRTGRHQAAARLFGQAAACRERSGSAPLQLQRSMEESAAAETLAAIGPADFSQFFAMGSSMSLSEAVRLGNDLASALSEGKDLAFTAASTAAIHLTSREQEVLRLLIAGLSDRAIAENLFIERSSVRTHVKNLFSKLAVNSRTAAATRAIQLGLAIAPAGQVDRLA